jgi:predicted anti-sigma-YlaC factor YlaD
VKLQCQFEQELLDAVAARRWPNRADAQLREHVAQCALCSDVAEIAGAFFEDRECARAEAVVPPASAIWWRAQIRAREEAARVAARPLLIFQTLATVFVAIVAIALAPTASTWIRGSLATLGGAEFWALPRDVSLSWILSAAAYTTLPLLAVGVWVVLAPVLVYLALDE